MAGVQITAMTAAFAADIVTWRYPSPYDTYDMTSVDPATLTDPALGYFALADEGRLIGYRCFGDDGQVPGGSYDSSALDTGGGLRPELTGRGLGRQAIEAGLEFGRRQYGPPAFRVTVASFNARALHVVGALGFEPVSSFSASTDGRAYQILVRGEPASPASGPGPG
jgi:[ribosomal protein S18]-alanine N-acetyltransferase